MRQDWLRQNAPGEDGDETGRFGKGGGRRIRFSSDLCPRRRSRHRIGGSAAATQASGSNDDDYLSGGDDDHGHGTHVCGTVAQSTDNALMVAGIAFGCTVMPVKVLDSEGAGTDAQLIQGMAFAAGRGVVRPVEVQPENRRAMSWEEFLRGARLAWADLSGVNFTGADLSDADLRNADLRGAVLTDAILTNADLTGAQIPDGYP